MSYAITELLMMHGDGLNKRPLMNIVNLSEVISDVFGPMNMGVIW